MKIKADIPKKDIQKAMQTIRKYGRANLQGAIGVVKRTAVKVDRDAKLKTPVNEGVLRASAYINIDSTGLVANVGFNADYAFFVENGRGPGGFPPLKMLARWAYLKRIVPSDSLSNPETKRVVYLIGRKIATYGTRPQPFLKPAFQANIKDFYREMLLELRRLERRV